MTTKYQQTNKENTGIDPSGVFPGYNHEDGLVFDIKRAEHRMNEHIVPVLFNLYNNLSKRPLKYILDVGSGAGNLAYFLRNSDLIAPDVEVFTLDGNRETINSPFVDKERHFVVRTDKEYNLVNNEGEIIKFDLITSFEHLEHIQPHQLQTFFKNLQRHSHSDTIFLATAANYHHHQEGYEHVHCNVKPIEGWVNFTKENKDVVTPSWIDFPMIAKATRGLQEQKGYSPTQAVEAILRLHPHQIQRLIIKNFFTLGSDAITPSEFESASAWTHRLISSYVVCCKFRSEEGKNQ